MFPLLMLASRLSPILKSVSGSAFSLKGKTKETTTQSSADKQADEVETVLDKDGKEHAADSPKGKMIINMRREEETPEMFGGMDLNKIKSALDEDSPLGMPEEVKGGVYKQIFEVNKMMLGSLQRIEGTLKLMLNLEYERALAFQQADVQQNLIEADTDDDGDESGPGRFRRGLSAAGGMLGGAYSKAKGSSIMKLLGLGVLIFAFNKYKDEIIGAMAGILKYFKDVYNVFKAEGIGAAFDKVVDDFKNIFFPKIRDVGISVLEFVWGAIKGTAKEFLLGAKGDKKIRQDVRKKGASTTSLTRLQGAGADLDKATGFISNLGGTSDRLVIRNKGFEAMGIDKDSAEASAIQTAFGDAVEAMQALSRESDGRIQFVGFPDMRSKSAVNDFFEAGGSIQDVINAVPLIDGNVSTIKDLKAFGLFKSAGVTKNTPETVRDEIQDNLSDINEIARLLNDPLTKRGGGYTFSKRKANENKIKFKGNYYTDDELKALMKSKLSENTDLGAFSGEAFQVDDRLFTTEGDTPAKEEVRKISSAFLSMQTRFSKMNYERAMNSQRPLTYADQKTINNVNASTTNNMSLSGENNYWSARLFSNAGTVLQQGN